MPDPGIYVETRDQSEYPVLTSTTIPCFFGGASKGPVNEPTMVNGLSDLIDKFGKPLTTDYGLLSAAQCMENVGRIYFVRVSDGTEAKADVAVPRSDVDQGFASGNTVNFEAYTEGEWANDYKIDIERRGDEEYAEEATGSGGPPPTQWDVTLANQYVVPGTVLVTLTFVNGSGVTVTDSVVDDGQGGFTAGTYLNTGAASYIDYDTGTVQVTDTGPAGSDHECTVSYKAAQADDSIISGWSIGVLSGSDSVYDLTNLKDGRYSDTNYIQPGSLFVFLIDDTTSRVLETAWDDSSGNVVFGTTYIDDGTGGAATITIDYTNGRLTFDSNTASVHGNDLNVFVGYSDPFFKVNVQGPLGNDTSQVGTIETFEDCVTETGSPRLVDTVINEGVKNEHSESALVTAEALTEGLPEGGTYDMSGGVNGVSGLTAADYVGTVSSGSSTGLKTILNKDRYRVDIICVPGVTDAAVTVAMLSTAESRGDCFACIDAPQSLDQDTIIDWHNGTGSYSSRSQLNSPYGALYWTWQKFYDAYNEQETYLPPSGFVAAAFVNSADSTFPWFAVAGETRGRILGAIEPKFDATREQRATMYDYPNAVNPVTEIENAGIVIWGQKTLYRANTARNRLDTMCTIFYIQRQLEISGRILVFEKNDATLWARFTQIATEILQYVQTNRGVSSFSVKCDSSTNTPAVINNNEMKAEIYFTPTKTAEVIKVDIVVQAEGGVTAT